MKWDLLNEIYEMRIMKWELWNGNYEMPKLWNAKIMKWENYDMRLLWMLFKEKYLKLITFCEYQIPFTGIIEYII